MKIIVVIGLLSFMFSGCEENFNPIGEFRQEYSMNCVLQGSKSIQYLSLYRTYEVDKDGNPIIPYDNTVKEATVRMWVDDSVYFFRDTVLLRSSASNGRTDSVYCYYLNGFTPLKNKTYEIDALFKTGMRVNGSIRMPDAVSISSLMIPPQNKESWEISWQATETGKLYIPKLLFQYSVREGTVWKYKSVNMPIAVISRNGKKDFAYVGPNRTGSFTMTKEALDEFITTILSERADPKQIYIEGISLEVDICDQNLTAFYQSTVMNADDFSINLEALDFDNINFGLGFYGGYTVSKSGFNIDFDNYLISYGFSYTKY